MKKFMIFLNVVATIVMVLWEIAEILFIPAVLSVIGIMNQFPWQYYIITIGGYFLAAILIQPVCHFVFHRLERKYTPLFERFLNRFFDKLFTKK